MPVWPTKIQEREPRDLKTAFRHAVRLKAYDRAVDGNYYSEQQKLKGGRNKNEDGLSRKVAQLENRLEQVQKATLTERVGCVPDPTIWHVSFRTGVWQLCELLYACYLLTYLPWKS